MPRPLRLARRTTACAAALFLSVGLLAPVAAQNTAFGTKSDTKAPVEVNADNLAVDQKSGRAVWTGNVVIVQGPMRLSADKVTAIFTQGDQRKIQAFEARGNVTMVNGADAAEAQAADYTVGSGNVVLTGNVLLTQGPSVLSGEKVTVDLATGTANVSGRVRSVLQPGTK
ncbi:lipopolysaccharide transport periplasmic protein LptA [Paracoccus aminophilus]|uniref:Lipopolysaccharide export system protein LptA n=1 Tax=Paracoccus aminophilus JCM 7686 TaxID=1367847 RepID=S5YY02_PARAH|nr:lipopolysaccharide transport periplasmic protein LptA [Paracoccus aminophilus]AGT10046.1 lipopolysaccharide export system protein LptA [Paracoccus aminophilus JCM 7686]